MRQQHLPGLELPLAQYRGVTFLRPHRVIDGASCFSAYPCNRITDTQKSVWIFSFDAEGAPKEAVQSQFFLKI